MAFNCIVVQSSEIDSYRALGEILEKSKEQLRGSVPIAGMVFMGIDHNHQVLADGICDQWPDICLTGCTTDGEFSSEQGYKEDSIVLTLIISDTCKAYGGFIHHMQEDVDDQCAMLYQTALTHLNGTPKLGILFSEALKISGEKVLDSLFRVTKGKLPIVGGISADSTRNFETIQLCGRKVSAGISTVLFLQGDFDFSWGTESGWQPFGEEGVITKSEGNQLIEINHKPALEFYWETLGDDTKPTNEMPIAIYDEAGHFRYLRTSLQNCDLNTGVVTYLGNIPPSGTVKIAMVNRDDIILGAEYSAKQALAHFPKGKQPVLMLGFTCSARRALLGTRTREEFDRVRSLFNSTVLISGFYTYGEICPSRLYERCEFHNETFVTVLLG